MNKYSKVVLLFILLVIPGLVFLFLKIFGRNHFNIPVYYAIDSISTDKGYKITKAHTIPEFQLLNQDGDIITKKSLEDKIFVANFFFTRCPGICPKMSTELSRLQETFFKDNEIKIISFSVDPEYDRPDTLRKYATNYSANLNQWTFVTGIKDSIYTLAQKGFFLSAMEDKERPIEFIHSDKLVLLDKNGWIRGYYNGTDRKDVDRLIDEIRVLKNSYKQQ